MYVVLGCGDRHWKDWRAIWAWLDRFHDQVAPARLYVLEGGAAGADAVFRSYRRARNYAGHTVEAQWTQYGKAAVPRRNAEMCAWLLAMKKNGNSVLCVAAHDDLDASKGTRDMVNKAKAADIRVKILKHRVA